MSRLLVLDTSLPQDHKGLEGRSVSSDEILFPDLEACQTISPNSCHPFYALQYITQLRPLLWGQSRIWGDLLGTQFKE